MSSGKPQSNSPRTPRRASPVKSQEKKSSAAAPRKIYSEVHISLFFIFVCLLQTIFLGSLLWFYNSLNIPDVKKVAAYHPDQATVIYDRAGHIVDRMFTENRSVVPLSRMSPHLPKAFVAAEDGRFYEHPGLDLWSVLRALINNLRDGERSQGGSTITQQVIKSLLLSPEKTYIRKFKEAILAWRIDKLLSKDDILYVYLNQIYLGEGAHGVEAAAQVYFGKSAAELSLGQCALLAGLPQAPSRYALFDHLDAAVERQRYVLNRMAADGYITAAQARTAFDEPVMLNRDRQRAGPDNGYYLEQVKRQARAILGGALQSAGAKIYTCLDSNLQHKASEAVRSGLRDDVLKKATARSSRAGKGGDHPEGALVCMDVASGRVRALVGGSSFQKTPFDRAIQAKRQAGSTFKPFVFAVALQQGMLPNSTIEDRPLSIRGRDGRAWSPKNYSGRYLGRTDLSSALAYSLNSATIRLLMQCGVKPVRSLAKQCGLTADLPTDLSLALGTVDTNLLELTAAYRVFGGDGAYLEPLFIEKIVTAAGQIIDPGKARVRTPVLDGSVLIRLQVMLEGVISRGTGKKAADVPGIRGGKTGTTDDYKDAWFIGYSERYVTGVWVGMDRNHSLGEGASGGSVAVPIFREFMMKAGAK